MVTESQQEETQTEVHDYPGFIGQYHSAVWIQVWTSAGTNELEPPDGVPFTCAICGKERANAEVHD